MWQNERKNANRFRGLDFTFFLYCRMLSFALSTVTFLPQAIIDFQLKMESGIVYHSFI